jgi:hypothetical protein
MMKIREKKISEMTDKIIQIERSSMMKMMAIRVKTNSSARVPFFV